MAFNLNSLTGGKTVSLPIIGTVGIGVAVGGAILLYLLLRKKRITSKTIITRFSK